MTQNRNDGKPLLEWLRRQYGPDKPFKSPRNLSLAAGRNENQVARIEETGHATIDVLLDLARVTGESPLAMFVLGGWLTEAEVNTGLTVDEMRFLEKWRRLSLKDRQTLDEVAEGFLRSNEGSAPVPPAGPEPGHHRQIQNQGNSFLQCSPPIATRQRDNQPSRKERALNPNTCGCIVQQGYSRGVKRSMTPLRTGDRTSLGHTVTMAGGQ